MKLEGLVDLYVNDPRCLRVADVLNEKNDSPKNVHLAGLVGSVDSLVANSIFRNTRYTHLFILSDRDEAAYFLNDIETVIAKKNILFFPDSFKKPGHINELNNNSILQRTEMINQLANTVTRGEIIVTYPEALFEKVVKPSALKKQTLFFKVGEKLDDDFIIEILIDNGFSREDFVYEPGQFSVRGGIIDIFSFGNEFPYRIELFDDEVESIRNFDPESQLSDRKISQVTIVPNIQTQFSEFDKVSLFKVLPPKTLIWFKHAEMTFDGIQKCYEKATEIKAQLDPKDIDEENEFLLSELGSLFEDKKSFKAAISRFDKIEFGISSSFKNSDKIDFETKPQPSFNKNFDLLIEDFKASEKDGKLNFLFSDNKRQFQRFENIFEDLKADVKYHSIPHAISKGFIDNGLKLCCYSDHQIFDRFHKYKLKKGFSQKKAITIKALKALQPGDFVTHIDHGIGVFSGLQKLDINGQVQEAVRLIYQNNDLLYVGINSLHKIAKYSGKEGTSPRLNKLGSDAWQSLKRRTKRKVKDIAKELILLYAKRKSAKGFAFSPDNYMQSELEASFIYEDTPDQYKASVEVKEDMEAESPMDRLVCGDVGFGKTEVAIRAAFKACCDSKQVAILVPTTILALQHYKTFSERLKDFPVKIDYINRFKTAKEKRLTLEALEKGKVDILIGTHSIVGKSVKFKDLGLLVIDEEQKFGVAVKEKLRKLKNNVDTLTLTATPIPRTLQFSLMAARDLSVMRTPPPNRQPVQTELHVFNPELIKDALYFEIYRGGQAFFIHNRVKDIVEVQVMISKLCPDLDIEVAHGQMEGKQLEEVLLKFMQRKIDVLVCTNIVESGLDIPNMNTIIINNAQWFGLSDLHQLRGRVGRSNKKAFCYLFAPPMSAVSQDARKRLRTIEEFADLGSGFNIAMRDLDIRGAGNLLGGEQSGFIADIGFDMYHKILDEAIQELKESEFKDLFKNELATGIEYVRDCQIDSDASMLIPLEYVNNSDERMSLYVELNSIKNEEELEAYKNRLIDRFGPLPIEVFELMNALRLKWLAKKIGIERIALKGGKMRCIFVENQESTFYESALFQRILNHITSALSRKARLKQTDKYLMLIFEGVRSMKQSNELLNEIRESVYTVE